MSKINVGKVSPVPKGNWGGANAAYEKLNMVNYNGVLYIAKQDIAANSNIAITNTTYWMQATNNWSIGTVNTINDSTASASASISEGTNKKLINLTIPRVAFDTEIIDDTASVGDTTVTWSADKIFTMTKLFVNVANYTNGSTLSSDNIVSAINAALEDSCYIYIPAGEYEFDIIIEKDCTILLDKETYISPTEGTYCIHARNCSFSLIGGHLLSGDNTDSRDPIAKSILRLYDCHDCLIYGIDTPYSQSPAIILLKNSESVEIQQCTFDHILQSAIEIDDHCVNVAVRNCTFKNSRYRNFSGNPAYYCYFVYTGISDWEAGITPTEGLIYENNYCYNSEDSGLDTHGARNVIIRNNIVLDAVCAITAYNDNRRVKRPDGWGMDNVLVENNYCKSSKGNDPLTSYPHPFILVGAANGHSSTETGYETNPGRYDAFTNFTLRNNVFINTGTYTNGITLHAISRNVVIENNKIDFPNRTNTIYCGSSINLIMRNNQFVSKYVFKVDKSIYAEISDKVIINGNSNYFQHFNSLATPDANYSYWNTINKQYGFVSNNSNRRNVAYNGTTAITVDASYTGSLTDPFTITVTDGIAYQPNTPLLPNMKLRYSEGLVYVRDLIDIDHLTFTKSGGSLADGTYEFTLEYSDLVPLGNVVEFMKTNTSDVKVYEQLSSSSTVLATLSANTNVIGLPYANILSAYMRKCLIIDDGTFIVGWIKKAEIDIV